MALPEDSERDLCDSASLPFVSAPRTSFDIIAEVQNLLLLQEKEQNSGGLFSLSPLTSAESSPASSPRQSFATLPDEESSPLTSVESYRAPSPRKLSVIHPAVDQGSNVIEPPTLLAIPAAASTCAAPASSCSAQFSGVRTSSKKTKLTNKLEAKKTPQHRKDRRITQSRAARSKKRERQMTAVTAHCCGRDAAWDKYVASADTVSTYFSMEQCSVASTAFVGLKDKSKSQKVYKLEEAIGKDSKLKFGLVKWGGKKSTKIVDASGRAVVILAGHPDDPEWPQLQKDSAEAIEMHRPHCHIPNNKSKKSKNRRGAFTALNCGVSHGGGQDVPGNLSNDGRNEELLEELNGLQTFKRLSGFASSVLSTWSKDLHTYYSTTIDTLHREHPHLRRVFPGSVFSACSYNLGPHTVCKKHRDWANLPFGMCAVTALGSFDPTKGGHLILWELELVVEFPPGSTILLPSALISHSNVSIGNDERRYSFAQYTAGALFRWVEHGCKTKEQFLATLTPEGLLKYEEGNASRWEKGISMFPTL